MKFIEIGDGVSVNLDRISVIQSMKSGKTKIQVGDEMYTSSIPYETFQALLVKEIQKGASAALEQLAKYQATPTP